MLVWGKGKMTCNVCSRPLEEAQNSREGHYKSCPNCSTLNGHEHVFYHRNYFGYTNHRVTRNNPDGIQSWCSSCRGSGNSSGEAILCSQTDM